MCGRFVVASAGSDLVGVLRVDVEGDDLPAPSYNVAPTDRAAIVMDSAKTDPPNSMTDTAVPNINFFNIRISPPK